MKPLEVAFLRRLVADKPGERRLTAVAEHMAANEGVGRNVGAKVVYTDADHIKAANLLLSRGFASQAPTQRLPRSQAPDAASEKVNALRVTHQLVAVVPLDMPLATSISSGRFLAMSWQEAIALPYEVLLVCENLEPMLQLREFTWLASFTRRRPTLALFRGAPGWFRTDIAAHLIAHDTRPTLAFFDFDPKGLSMAASLKRREALCLPARPKLEAQTKRLRRVSLFADQLDASRAHLDSVRDPEIAAAWRHMLQLGLGLNQEGFPR